MPDQERDPWSQIYNLRQGLRDVGRAALMEHRDWCDYRLDVMKGCFVCRECDCPQDNQVRAEDAATGRKE